MSGTICARINHEWSQLKTFYNCWISAYLYSRGGGMHYTESEMFGLYGLDTAWLAKLHISLYAEMDQAGPANSGTLNGRNAFASQCNLHITATQFYIALFQFFN